MGCITQFQRQLTSLTFETKATSKHLFIFFLSKVKDNEK